jgi:8-oxo-dGTP pyrophosphatase MutT (NUDIX family)
MQFSDHAPLQKRPLVAAVCFRILSTGVEFLLIRTRRGRWTFPKGGVGTGLTHAQSAALEAFEEAGVHGRIEEVAFVRYRLRKSAERGGGDDFVSAHLCEVLRNESPQELNRDPTWCSAVKAKRRLEQGRSNEHATELARVVDRALARIRRFPARTMLASDPLMRVRFEASEMSVQQLGASAAMKFQTIQSSRVPSATVGSEKPGSHRGKILQLPPAQLNRT